MKTGIGNLQRLTVFYRGHKDDIIVIDNEIRNYSIGQHCDKRTEGSESELLHENNGSKVST